VRGLEQGLRKNELWRDARRQLQLFTNGTGFVIVEPSLELELAEENKSVNLLATER
jgi:hypothetical protein